MRDDVSPLCSSNAFQIAQVISSNAVFLNSITEPETPDLSLQCISTIKPHDVDTCNLYKAKLTGLGNSRWYPSQPHLWRSVAHAARSPLLGLAQNTQTSFGNATSHLARCLARDLDAKGRLLKLWGQIGRADG